MLLLRRALDNRDTIMSGNWSDFVSNAAFRDLQAQGKAIEPDKAAGPSWAGKGLAENHDVKLNPPPTDQTTTVKSIGAALLSSDGKPPIPPKAVEGTEPIIITITKTVPANVRFGLSKTMTFLSKMLGGTAEPSSSISITPQASQKAPPSVPEPSPLEKMKQAALTQLAKFADDIRDMERELGAVAGGSKKEKLAFSEKIRDLEETLRERKNKLSDLAERARMIVETETREELSDLLDRFNNLYQNKMEPLLIENAKLVAPLRSFTTEAKMTAQAAGAGPAILSKLESGAISKNVASAQDVILFPGMGVFKKGKNVRPVEDEDRALNVLAFLAPGAAVETWKTHTTSRQEFLSPEIAKLKYTVSTQLSNLTLKNKIISPDKWKEFEEHRKIAEADTTNRLLDFSTPEQKAAYQRSENIIWNCVPIGSGDGIAQMVTLDELHKLVFEKKADLTTLTRVGADGTITPLTLQERKDLITALSVPFTSKIEVDIYPDFKSPEQKKAYENSEKILWNYVDSAGATKTVSFKELNMLHLQGKVMIASITKVGKSGSELPSLGEWKDLMAAIKTQWGVLGKDLLITNDSKTYQPVGNVQAKPFIGDMKLMSSLTKTQINSIFSHMSPESQRNAIATGMIQLMDLHAGNIGVTPDGSPDDPGVNKEYKKLKDTMVQFPGGQKAVKDLLMDFVDNKLSEYDVYTYTDPITKQQKTGILAQLPELEAALDTEWKLELFDLDRNFGESNMIQKFGTEVYLPFRSALLGTDWAMQPLDSKVLEKLKESDQNSEAMHAWIRKDHSAIYKQLNREGANRVRGHLEPILSTYSRAKTAAANGSTSSLKDIEGEFVRVITEPQHDAFWQQMADDLYRAAIDSAIARKQDPSTAKKVDLSGRTAESIDKREGIAKQLFPNLTVLQEKALTERETRSKEYLSDFSEFNDSVAQGPELIAVLDTYLDKKTNSLTDDRRTELKQELQNLGPTPSTQALKDFRDKIKKECQPTFFNLMKVMYPLLGDVFQLVKKTSPPQSDDAIRALVANNLNIKRHIYYAENSSSPQTVQLGKKIQQAIDGETAPSYQL
jgi:hypothetical protein